MERLRRSVLPGQHVDPFAWILPHCKTVITMETYSDMHWVETWVQIGFAFAKKVEALKRPTCMDADIETV